MRIIDGGRSELDAAAEIWAEATAARDGDPTVAPLALARPVLQDVLDASPRAMLLLAVGDRPRGFAALAPAEPTVAELRYFGVRPVAWGAGVGSRLLAAMPGKLAAAGFTRARLLVSARHAAPASAHRQTRTALRPGARRLNTGEPGSVARVDEPAEQPKRPLLRVVRGEPDDAELAALTAVVAGLAGAAAADQPQRERRSHWADRAMLLRRPLRPGPTAWRGAGYPQ